MNRRKTAVSFGAERLENIQALDLSGAGRCTAPVGFKPVAGFFVAGLRTECCGADGRSSLTAVVAG
jgi:hypothetical protein